MAKLKIKKKKKNMLNALVNRVQHMPKIEVSRYPDKVENLRTLCCSASTKITSYPKFNLPARAHDVTNVKGLVPVCCQCGSMVLPEDREYPNVRHTTLRERLERKYWKEIGGEI